MGYGMILYMVSMLTLFGNFYLQTYRQARSKGKETQERNTAVANGVSMKNNGKKVD